MQRRGASSSRFFFSSSLAGVTLLLRALATTAVVVSLVESFDDFEYCDSSFLSLVFSFADDDDVFVFLVVSVLFLTFFTEPEDTFVFRVFFSSACAFSSRLFFLLTHFEGSCHSCAAMICASSRLPIFFVLLFFFSSPQERSLSSSLSLNWSLSLSEPISMRSVLAW